MENDTMTKSTPDEPETAEAAFDVYAKRPPVE